ncbi:protein prenylyltransferase [Sistotremastrum niveocremeum HHB9708]|uniref:Protein farnesyltransferase/geranylgeranyltransferase type-1 subunit alpha n=2 Tax=Sistotremastraceae TaxID=3402574 RepID=A0A164XR58_9AGAM|nr:protein prenylyltransferase [Sistotremastrum niveocremeum HHB9708]KZT35384.1 protein prenylyltransferase [Sistotremastrum suecicum HHB10207 ss-3]
MPGDSVLYSERPEWSDIQPIAQYETVTPVAPIFYSDEYKDATGYFRAVVKANERSERVLQLTEHIIRLNPGHYSVWQYRWSTLLALGSSLEDELLLMDELATTYLKTYQVWHHRRLIITELGGKSNPARELRFIRQGLNVDSKNYHTWAYRQWLLAHFNEDALWEGELPFVEEMLDEDVRNNSAWHHRFFTVWQSGVRAGEEDREYTLNRELSYTKEKIALAPNNGSAWNYLRGVLDFTKTSYSTLRTFIEPYTAPRDESEPEVLDLDNPLPSKDAQLPCVAAIEFLAEIYESEVDNAKRAAELYRSLAEVHDKIREKYWNYRVGEALSSAGQVVAS